MKRVLFFVIVLAIVLVATYSIAETYYVTTEIDALNVRDAVDTDTIYGCIRAGKKVEVDYVDGKWAYIQYDGKNCKVYFPYLTKTGDPSQPEYYGGKTGGGTKKTSTQKVKENLNLLSTDVATIICKVSDTVKTNITVRSSKSDNGTIIGRLYPGDILYVAAEGNVWSRIVYNGRYAFVKSRYIETIGYNLPDEGTLKRFYLRNNTGLNVREGPSLTEKVITTIPSGSYVKVLEDDGTWSNVYYTNDKQGYVMSKFLEDVE